VPGALIALAALGVAVLARRWRRRSGGDPPAAAGPELEPGDARRLDQELRAFDA
jgi:hypothetical protein